MGKWDKRGDCHLSFCSSGSVLIYVWRIGSLGKEFMKVTFLQHFQWASNAFWSPRCLRNQPLILLRLLCMWWAAFLLMLSMLFQQLDCDVSSCEFIAFWSSLSFLDVSRFDQFGRFTAISSNIFSALFSLSSPSWTAIMYMLVCLMLIFTDVWGSVHFFLFRLISINSSPS